MNNVGTGRGTLGPRRHREGFSLIELLVVMTIIGLVMVAAVPASMRFYESIQYRQAIRDVVTLLASARHAAVSSGQARDVLIDPRAKQLRLGDHQVRVPQSISMLVSTAAELNSRERGIIRFYPEGGSSGGDINLERESGDGVLITVDWLVGGVEHQRYALD